MNASSGEYGFKARTARLFWYVGRGRVPRGHSRLKFSGQKTPSLPSPFLSLRPVCGSVLLPGLADASPFSINSLFDPAPEAQEIIPRPDQGPSQHVSGVPSPEGP